MKRQTPQKAPTASPKQATRFNEVVYTDVFWVKTATGKVAILSTEAGATRYSALRANKTETTDELIKAIERGWIRQFGPMGELRTDDGSGFASDEFTQFLVQHGINIAVAAGEARAKTVKRKND